MRIDETAPQVLLGDKYISIQMSASLFWLSVYPPGIKMSESLEKQQ